MSGLRIREAIRALVVDEADRIVLVRFEFPTATVWALPGGGIEPEETPFDALRRELHEELGLTEVEIGPPVWHRLHIVPFTNGLWDGQRETAHLVRVRSFEPTPVLSWDELRTERLHEIRWWEPAELRAASHVRFAPGALARFVADVLEHGAPPEPFDAGI